MSPKKHPSDELDEDLLSDEHMRTERARLRTWSRVELLPEPANVDEQTKK